MDNREKQAAYKARMREKGFTLVAECIPATQREAFKQFAKSLEVEATERGVTAQLGDDKPIKSRKGKTVEDHLVMDAARDGAPVEEHLLRKVAEDLYWLHLMLSRKLAGGSTSMPSTLPDQQNEMFGAWVKGLKSVSGRLGVFKVDKANGLKINLKPYTSAPVRINLSIDLES